MEVNGSYGNWKSGLCLERQKMSKCVRQKMFKSVFSEENIIALYLRYPSVKNSGKCYKDPKLIDPLKDIFWLCPGTVCTDMVNFDSFIIILYFLNS